MSAPGEPRFLVDENLHGLVRLLRLLGFDAVGAVGEDDRTIAARARRERRRLLTRDRALASVLNDAFNHSFSDDLDAARADTAHGALRPKAEHAWVQLAEVVSRLGLAEQAAPYTRCLVCNTPVVRLTQAEAKRRLPRHLHTADMHADREPRGCPGCGRVYWRGSHVSRMNRKLAEILGNGSTDTPR